MRDGCVKCNQAQAQLFFFWKQFVFDISVTEPRRSESACSKLPEPRQLPPIWTAARVCVSAPASSNGTYPSCLWVFSQNAMSGYVTLPSFEVIIGSFADASMNEQ